MPMSLLQRRARNTPPETPPDTPAPTKNAGRPDVGTFHTAGTRCLRYSAQTQYPRSGGFPRYPYSISRNRRLKPSLKKRGNKRDCRSQHHIQPYRPYQAYPHQHRPWHDFQPLHGAFVIGRERPNRLRRQIRHLFPAVQKFLIGSITHNKY